MTTPESHEHSTSESFFQALFDWDFNTFITRRAIKVVYIIWVALVAIGALFLLIAAISRGGVGGLIGGIIFIPLGALLYIILFRISLEIIAVIFKIGEDASSVRTALEK